jgi:hypothetical protein
MGDEPTLPNGRRRERLPEGKGIGILSPHLVSLYADCRPPSHQAPNGLVPEDMITSGFDSS